MSTDPNQPETTDDGVWREDVTLARERPISIPKGHREALGIDHGDTVEIRIFRDRDDPEPVMTEYCTVWSNTYQIQIRAGAFDEADVVALDADIWLTKRRDADES